MKRCRTCHSRYPPRYFPLWSSRRHDTCWSCIKRRRRDKRLAELAEAVKPWPVVIASFDLSPSEQHAVDLAAGQALIFEAWRNRHPGQPWPGPSAEAVVDAETSDEVRRRHLLAAASWRQRELRYGS